MNSPPPVFHQRKLTAKRKVIIIKLIIHGHVTIGVYPAIIHIFRWCPAIFTGRGHAPDERLQKKLRSTESMKRLSITQLIPGMITAEDVYDLEHELVVPKGTVLTDKLITKLDLYGILTIYAEDILPELDPPKEPSETESSYYERIKSSPEFQLFKEEFESEVELFRENMNLVVQKNTELDVKTLLQNTLAIVANHSGNISLLDMLQNMREYDDSTYTHSLNVALICNILAGWLKLPEEEVELATACGLFHDIGKMMIPYSIIAKPGKLSAEEFATVKTHPTLGFELLQSQDVDEHVKNAALMHHERNDGSGYPQKLKGNQIDPYARMVAIADVYDAMTAARCYRGPLCPFRVIEMFEAEGFQKYDVSILLPFLKNVVNSCLQNQCLLSDGRKGTIIYINKEKLSRPVVQCGEEYVNLADQPDVEIEKLL